MVRWFGIEYCIFMVENIFEFPVEVRIVVFMNRPTVPDNFHGYFIALCIKSSEKALDYSIAFWSNVIMIFMITIRVETITSSYEYTGT